MNAARRHETPARGHTSPLPAPGRDAGQDESVAIARGFLSALAILCVLAGVGLALIADNLNGAHLIAPLLVLAGGALLVSIVIARREERHREKAQLHAVPSGEVHLEIDVDTSRLTGQSALVEFKLAGRPRRSSTATAATRRILLEKAYDGDQHTKDRGQGFDGLRAHLRVDSWDVAR